MAVICMLIAVPLGILGAIFLIEYARGTKVARAVSFTVDILSGIPSIVAALFIYALFITIFGLGRSAIAVSFALVLLMLPTVLRSTEEMLKLVPDFTGGLYALGLQVEDGPEGRHPDRVQRHRHRRSARRGQGDGRNGAAADLGLVRRRNQLLADSRYHGRFADHDQHRSRPGPATRLRAGLGGCMHFDLHRDGAQPARPRHHAIQQAQGEMSRWPNGSISSLDVFYGGFHAVEDVSMTVEPRTVTAFIGPSGCGKSTLLRTLNRMHEVIPGAYVKGSVKLDGTDLYGSGVDPVAVRRVVGMVFQRPNPFPSMTIFDNVASGLRLNGVKNKGVLAEAVERALLSANLWTEVKDRLGKAGIGLSGVSSNGSASPVPSRSNLVILMDEPCSSLDPISTLAIEDLIGELKERYTVVIVTHNMQQAARVSDQTAFFNLAAQGKPGKLIEVGSTEKIFSNPDQKATEDYITGRFG